jgi:hypothetical protein
MSTRFINLRSLLETKFVPDDDLSWDHQLRLFLFGIDISVKGKIET